MEKKQQLNEQHVKELHLLLYQQLLQELQRLCVPKGKIGFSPVARAMLKLYSDDTTLLNTLTKIGAKQLYAAHPQYDRARRNLVNFWESRTEASKLKLPHHLNEEVDVLKDVVRKAAGSTPLAPHFEARIEALVQTIENQKEEREKQSIRHQLENMQIQIQDLKQQLALVQKIVQPSRKGAR